MSSTQECQDCGSGSHTNGVHAAQPGNPSMASSSSPAGPSSTGATTDESNGTGTNGPQAVTNIESIVPPVRPKPAVTIEFCDRCRWAPRATWIQTELFLTFPTPAIQSITLIPLNAPETGGRFRVWLDRGQGDELLWDRKTEGGFPELKVLKQRLRNLIMPDMSLGHSDKPAASPTSGT